MHKLSNVEIIREVETAVRVPQGVNRFITILGSMPDVLIAGDAGFVETYTCLVGPVMDEHEVLGVSWLPCITSLHATTLEVAQCLIESWDAEWDEESRRVELQLQLLLGASTEARATILFSVTILAAT